MKNDKWFTRHQLGAFITLLLIAGWGIWLSMYHFSRPMGMEWTEILFLSVLIPAYLILLPLYLVRVRWSYICGVLALLGLVIGALKAILDYTFFFSVSAYNLLTFLAYLLLFSCIYFSIRSFSEQTCTKLVWNAVGMLILVILPIVVVSYVSQNRQEIENNHLRRVIHRMQTWIGDIDEFDRKIEALMTEGDIPSLVTAIVVNDRIVWAEGFGKDSNTDWIYDMGSISKTFIATALLQLYERNLVDLDEDVSTYLPFAVRHPLHPDVTITLRMLLTHQACLGHNTDLYYAYMMGPELMQWGRKHRRWESWDEFGTLTYSDFMSQYLASGGLYNQPENWVSCKPGTTYSYSTPGFDILGYAVEQVSGMSLDDYLKENIFDPLQMTHSTSTPLDTPELMATPYERWYGVLSKLNVGLPLSQRRRVGGGGMYTNVNDLATYLLMHMNEGLVGNVEVLQPETITLMHQSVVEATGDFLQVAYGYGWSKYQVAPRQMWDITYQPRGYQGHGGRYWGYAGAMHMVDTTQGAYGYVVLMNVSMVESMDHPWIFAIQNNIQDLILQQAYTLYQSALNQY